MAFSNRQDAYLLDSNFGVDPKLKKAIKDWDIKEILQSSLFFFLQFELNFTDKTGSLFISLFLWGKTFNIALNPKVSMCTLLFVRELKLFKISTTEEIVGGLIKSLKRINGKLDLLAFEEVIDKNALKSV